jgi:RND family efflux transporter MFP subunit
VGSTTRVEDARRALAAAEAGAVQAAAALARAKDIRGVATLTAPQNGVVTQVFAEPGTTLSAGQPVLRLAGTGEREIIIDVTEQDVARLEIGAGYSAILAADPTVTARAELHRIDPVAERNTRTRRLHLTLDDPPSGFRLGALTRVTPIISADAGVAIPVGAVLDPDTAPAVWVVDRITNTVNRTAIKLGVNHGDYWRVVSGLSVGDEIITKGIHSVEDGQIVGPQVSR